MVARRFLRLSGSILAVQLAFVAAPAWSQDASATDDAIDKGEIVVTGTSLRGAPPVGSSLIQVGRAEIDASPAVTTTQLVREVPQIFNFGVTDSARNQSGGAGNIVYGNSINIRGLGPFATLTLINGRRPVAQGTLGASVDPGNIPAIALERVEIIADGASAVYGSDAVAGVANLILRRRYEGIGADVQYGWGADNKEFTANAIVGQDWGSGYFTLAGQHSYRSALSGLDRDFYNSDLRARGGADYRVTQCFPGNLQIANAGVTTNYAIPAGGATSANLVAGTTNRCDNIKSTDILPEQETNSVSLTFDQDITDRLHLFIDGLWARRDGFRKSAVVTQNLVVPSTNAFFVAPAGVDSAVMPGNRGGRSGGYALRNRAVQLLGRLWPLFDNRDPFRSVAAHRRARLRHLAGVERQRLYHLWPEQGPCLLGRQCGRCSQSRRRTAQQRPGDCLQSLWHGRRQQRIRARRDI